VRISSCFKSTSTLEKVVVAIVCLDQGWSAHLALLCVIMAASDHYNNQFVTNRKIFKREDKFHQIWLNLMQFVY
jgi:hypothetical protein